MTLHRRRAAGAVALAVGVLAVGVLGFAAAASAHVTVDPATSTQGKYSRVVFRVPNESDTASTTKVEVNLPEATPVARVSLMPVPGWDAAVETKSINPPIEMHGTQVTEAVFKITWTAKPDAAIKPGQFQEFPVSIGPMPKADRMVFKTLQTYSDGNVVRWIEEPPAAGGEEPEHPAPVLALQTAAASPAPAGSVSATAPAADDDDDDDSDGGQAWGIAGLVAGLAGLLVGGLALVRGRQASATSTGAGSSTPTAGS